MFDGLFLGMEPRVVGLVLLTGFACGIVGALYLLVIHLLQHVLWPTEWSGLIGFAILGGVGVVVGLVVRFVGTPGRRRAHGRQHPCLRQRRPVCGCSAR